MRSSRSSAFSAVLVAIAASFTAGFNPIAGALEPVACAHPVETAVAPLLATDRMQPAVGTRHVLPVDRACAGCHIASHFAALPGFRGWWQAALQTSTACDATDPAAHCVERVQCRPH